MRQVEGMRLLVLLIVGLLGTGCSAQFALQPVAKPVTRAEVQSVLDQMNAGQKKQDDIIEFLVGKVTELQKGKK